MNIGTAILLGATLSLMSLTAAPAAAQEPVVDPGVFATGHTLLEYCEQDEEDFQWGLCIGYVIGSYRSMRVSRIVPTKEEPIYCSPDQPSLSDETIVNRVVEFFHQNEQVLDAPASIAILVAAQSIWPCSSNNESER